MVGVHIESIEWLHNHGHDGGLWRVVYFTKDGERTMRFYSGVKVRDAMEAYTRFMEEGADYND